jgi:hypothetical protein
MSVSHAAAHTTWVCLSPRGEFFITSEHGGHNLIEHVLGRLLQELRVSRDRLVVLAIQSRAVFSRAGLPRVRGLINGIAPSVREEDGYVDTLLRHDTRRAGDPPRDQAPWHIHEDAAVTCVRTNETRSRGVSDLPRATPRAKSGAADPGSLTRSPAAAGYSRGRRRRAMHVRQLPHAVSHSVPTRAERWCSANGISQILEWFICRPIP